MRVVSNLGQFDSCQHVHFDSVEGANLEQLNQVQRGFDVLEPTVRFILQVCLLKRQNLGNIILPDIVKHQYCVLFLASMGYSR